MENYELKREDIDNLWSQIVSQMGITRFSHTEWQTIYEDFWKCMLPESKAYVQIHSLERLMEPYKLQSLELHRKKTQLKTTPRMFYNMKSKGMPNNHNLFSQPQQGVSNMTSVSSIRKSQQLDKKNENVHIKPLRCLLSRINIASTEQKNKSNIQLYKLNKSLTEKKSKCVSHAKFSEKKFPNNHPKKNDDIDVTLIDKWLDNCDKIMPIEDDFEINGGFEYIEYIFLVNKYPLDIEITF